MFNGLEFFHSSSGYSPISSSANESEHEHHQHRQHQQQHYHNIPPLAVARATSYQNMVPSTSSSSSPTTATVTTISSSTSSSTLPIQYHAQHSSNHNQFVYASIHRYDMNTRQNTRTSSLNAIGDSMSEINVSYLFEHSTVVFI